jgi:NAD(P)-dependent dehydrogenase (short-subunit alcohol dehydrogenase family)
MNPASNIAAIARAYVPNADSLQGRVILITGAGSGIGKAVALACAAAGAQTILSSRSVKRLEATYDEISARGGAESSIAPLDLEKALAPHYDELATALQNRCGRLDGLVHCAGMLGLIAPLAHHDVATFYKVMHVNVTAAFALTQVLLPLLEKSPDASVVFTTSSAGRKGKAYWSGYVASKFAIEGLTQSLADEMSNSPIRVNAVNPGKARTAMRRHAYPSEDPATLADPATLCAPYLWLLSGESRGHTGLSLDAQDRERVGKNQVGAN